MINLLEVKLNDALSFLAVFIAFICATNGELANTNNTVIYYVPYLVCFAALMLELLLFFNKKFVIPSYLLWRIGIIIFFLFSIIYATTGANWFVIIKKYIAQSIVVFLISFKCMVAKENIQKFIRIAIVAMFFSLLYVLTSVDLAMVREGVRLGVDSLNEAWNANDIGLTSSMGGVLTWYIFFVHSKTLTKRQKTLGIILELFFLLFSVLSGYRKSLLIFFSALIIYYIRSSKSNKIRNITIAILGVSIVVYAIFNIPFLYEHIGYRFEGALDMLTGTGGDRSSQIRRDMLEIGLQAFKQKPFLGHGLNGFSIVYGNLTSAQVYSHNNYIEILVNTGIIGFLLYYGYIVRMVFVRVNGNKELIMFKAILIALLLADIGLVSYTASLYQYVLCLVICGISQKSLIPQENT